jgi:hypothetical protein
LPASTLRKLETPIDKRRRGEIRAGFFYDRCEAGAALAAARANGSAGPQFNVLFRIEVSRPPKYTSQLGITGTNGRNYLDRS